MSKKAQSYWKVNLKYLAILLSIWFLVSFLFGIAFAESLNQFNIAGFPLGFGLLTKDLFTLLLF